MSVSSSPRAPRVVGEAVLLLVGLAVVCGLLFISILALANAWLGITIGAIELLVAWRVRAPAGARSLRWVTGLMGAFTLGFSVLWLLAS